MIFSRPRTTIAALTVLLLATEAFGQCLHGPEESSAQRRRRESAVEYIAAVNAAQTQFRQRSDAYGPLHELQSLATGPVGFVPRLYADQFGYVLKVADALDPCRFTLFSDEHGVIFEARPTTVTSSPSEPVGPGAASPPDQDGSASD